MKKNWRKVVSALLTLIMLLGIFQGTGIKVSANDNPGIALEPTVTVNASVNGMEMDEETGCRIWVTLWIAR